MKLLHLASLGGVLLVLLVFLVLHGDGGILPDGHLPAWMSESSNSTRERRSVGAIAGILTWTSRINLVLGTISTIMGLTCLSMSIQSSVACGSSLPGYDICGKGKELQALSKEVNTTAVSLIRKEVSQVEAARDLENLVPKLTILGLNMEAVTEYYFNIAQDMKVLELDFNATLADLGTTDADTQINQRRIVLLVADYEKLSEQVLKYKMSGMDIFGSILQGVGALAFFGLNCIPRMYQSIKFAQIGADDIVLLGMKGNDGFRLGYDLSTGEHFVVKTNKYGSLPKSVFKTMFDVKKGVPSLGINPGTRYAANLAIDRHTNFVSFVDYMESTPYGRDFKEKFLSLSNDQQNVILEESTKIGSSKRGGVPDNASFQKKLALPHSTDNSNPALGMETWADNKINTRKLIVELGVKKQGSSYMEAKDFMETTYGISQQNQPSKQGRLKRLTKSISDFFKARTQVKKGQASGAHDVLSGVPPPPPVPNIKHPAAVTRVPKTKLTFREKLSHTSNRAKTITSQIRNSRVTQLALAGFETAMNVAGIVLCSLQIDQSVKNTKNTYKELTEAIAELEKEKEKLNENIEKVKNGNDDLDKFYEDKVKPSAYELLGLLSGEKTIWDNLKIKTEKTDAGTEVDVISLTEEDNISYNVSRIQRDTYSSTFTEVDFFREYIIKDERWETITAKELSAHLDEVIKQLETLKGKIMLAAGSTKALKITLEGVEKGDTVKNIINMVKAITNNDDTQWDALVRIAKVSSAEIYDGYPVGCIRSGRINSAEDLQMFIRNAGGPKLNDTKKITLGVYVDLDLPIEIITMKLGMTQVDVLKALATSTFPNDASLALGGQTFDLTKYRASC